MKKKLQTRAKGIVSTIQQEMSSGNTIFTTMRVCQLHFLATLDICEKTVHTALRYKGASGLATVEKKIFSPANKYDEVVIKGIKDHIDSFPNMESHYTRSDTNKKYLDCRLNVQKMYDLYVEECAKQEICKVPSIHKYREIFNTMNLSFHHPRKDRCLVMY